MNYRVDVSREGHHWVAEVQGVPGGATEVRRLVDLDVEVRDLLAGLLDTDEESLELAYDFRQALGDAAAKAWETFTAEREELYERQRQFEADRRSAIQALRDQGISTRDTAHLVGLSHQRVSQLLDA